METIKNCYTCKHYDKEYSVCIEQEDYTPHHAVEACWEAPDELKIELRIIPLTNWIPIRMREITIEELAKSPQCPECGSSMTDEENEHSIDVDYGKYIPAFICWECGTIFHLNLVVKYDLTKLYPKSITN